MLFNKAGKRRVCILITKTYNWISSIPITKAGAHNIIFPIIVFFLPCHKINANNRQNKAG